jgi:hypothetical protein
MLHAEQYATEDQEWSINWSPVIACPTGATLLSSTWTAVGATGMSANTLLGIEDEYFTTIRVTGGEPGALYVFRNDVVVWVDDETSVVEDRIEFFILP